MFLEVVSYFMSGMFVSSDILAVKLMKVQVFWGIKSYNFVNSCHYFERGCCPVILRVRVLKQHFLEAAVSYKMFVITCKLTR